MGIRIVGFVAISVAFGGIANAEEPQAERKVHIEDDIFDAPPSETAATDVCFVLPNKLSKAEIERLGRAIELSAEATRPKHAEARVIRVENITKEENVATCNVLVDFGYKRTKGGNADLTMSATQVGTVTPLSITTMTIGIKQMEEAPIRPGWEKAWKSIAPEPQVVAAPVQAAPAEQFVDRELTVELRSTLPPPPAPKRFVAAILARAGFASRSLEGGPSNALGRADVPSFGAEGLLHVGALASLPTEHEIDFVGSYDRRLARTELDGRDLGVTADRIRMTGVYRYALGEMLPSLGGYAGWELSRFELDPQAEVLSVRWSVLRVGAAAIAPIVRLEEMFFFGALDGGLRMVPGASGGDGRVGFDLGAGVGMQLDAGLFAKLRGDWISQRGNISGTAVEDTTLELAASVGWSL